MTDRRSTILISRESTLGNAGRFRGQDALVKQVLEYWEAQSQPNVLQAIKEYPALLSYPSIILDLSVEEYKACRRANPDLRLSSFGKQFDGLGSSLEKSIFRRLDVQQYLDEHPELLEFVENFEWPRPGDDLQGFHVIEELGRGSLARVYLCSEVGIGGRDIVLKVTRGEGNEASLLGRLDHPNIVPIYSLVNDSERWVTYICMPFRGRSTLQDLVDHAFEGGVPRKANVIIEAANAWREGLIDEGVAATDQQAQRFAKASYVSEVVSLVFQIAKGLAHAHKSGILHGDLKPSNVLLTSLGQPLLIDFNLAKDCCANAGPMGGTLPYMAPKQLQSIVTDLSIATSNYDVQSEVYSFGVLLYQLLAGRLPFHLDSDSTNPSEAAITLLDLQRKPVEDIRSANPLVDEQLVKLVRDCLAWEPTGRPQSMNEVCARLRSNLSFPAKMRRAALARPKLAKALVVSFVAVDLVIAILLWSRPPYYLREYDRGLNYQREHDFLAAVQCFDRSLDAHPSFGDALYQRARTEMLSGKLDTAIESFTRLSTSFRDNRGLACAGYCFDLGSQYAAAISRYEKALANGFDSGGLQNNLGVSYEFTAARLAEEDQLAAAEEHLQRANSLAPSSLVVQRNLLKLDAIKLSRGAANVSALAVERADSLTRAFPDDGEVWYDAARFYGWLAKRDPQYIEKCIAAIRTAGHNGFGWSDRQLMAEPSFESLKDRPEFPALCATLASIHGTVRQSRRSSFVDPVESCYTDGLPRN